MKIVQSFWSKPMLKSDKDIYQNRLYGGWRNYRYALAAMTYSCLTLRKFYDDVELYTDDFGIHLFRDELQLPYTRYHNVLNDLDIDDSFWAFGKIFTYSLQEEPFLHVDNDIFIWEKFPKRLELADVAGQNVEWVTPSATDDYTTALNYLRKNVPVCPRIILDSECRQAVNMGVFGGSDIEFIQRYALLAMKSIKDASPYLVSADVKNGVFNIIFEQLLLSEMAKKEARKMAYMIENCDSSDFSQYINIETAQFDVKYAHCIGLLKQSDAICEQVEYRLKCDFSEYHSKVLEYLDKKGLHYEENEESMKKFYDFSNIYFQMLPFKSKSDILRKCEFRLKRDFKIENEGDTYWIVNAANRIRLKRWGTFLIFFQDYVTGDSVSDYIYKKGLLGDMEKEKITESIFFLIIQSVYREKYLELKAL